MLLFLVVATLTAQQSPPPGNTGNAANAGNTGNAANAGNTAYRANTANTANTVNSTNTGITGNSGFHAYLPVGFVFPPDTLAGKVYIPTDGGLFVTDLDGRHLAKFDQQSGLPSSNMGYIFEYSDERRMLITSTDLQYYGCTFNPFASDGRTWLYELHADSVSVVAALPRYTMFGVSDRFGNLWLAVGNVDSYYTVYRMSADSTVTGPVYFNAFRTFRNPESGQIVITYYESLTQGGVRNVTFDGTEFVPYDGPVYPSWQFPGSYNPGDVRKSIYAAYPELPRNSTVKALREAPDGSLWYVDSIPEIICVANKSDDVAPQHPAHVAGNQIPQQLHPPGYLPPNNDARTPDASAATTIQSYDVYRQDEMTDFWMNSIDGGYLFRRTATGIEAHASWAQWTSRQPEGQHQNGIYSMQLTDGGDPLLGFRNYYGWRTNPGTTGSPMAWLYRAEGDQLYTHTRPAQSSSYYVNYHVVPAGSLGFFIHSNRELFWLTHQGVIELTLPDTLGSIVNRFSIQPDGLDRWIMHTWTGLVRLRLEGGVPEPYEYLPVSREQVGFRAVAPDGSVWLAALDRMLRHFGPDGTLLSERPIPGEHSITSILFPASVPTTGRISAGAEMNASVRSSADAHAPISADGSATVLSPASVQATNSGLSPGEVWVGTCGGGLLRYPTSGEPETVGLSGGLSSLCILDLHQGASGNIYIGSMLGYSIFGDPGLISGSARPEIFPSSVEESGAQIPSALMLHPNWPNPFNPATELRFDVPTSGGGGLDRVQLVVYDLLGREVARLVDQAMSAGNYTVRFDAGSLSSGVYLVRLQHGGAHTLRKITLLK
jgi:hypothetical protein